MPFRKKIAKEKINLGLKGSVSLIKKHTAVDVNEHLLSFAGAFVGIGLIAFLQSLVVSKNENIFLIGSFGASAVLVFAAAHSPLSQPRNLVGGQIISALIGVSIYKLFPDLIWVSAPLAVSLSIVCMQITKTLHPPGGATALIAVIGSEKIKLLGYLYVVFPVLSGALILFFVAVIINNISPGRKYASDNLIVNSFRKIFVKED